MCVFPAEFAPVMPQPPLQGAGRPRQESGSGWRGGGGARRVGIGARPAAQRRRSRVQVRDALFPGAPGPPASSAVRTRQSERGGEAPAPWPRPREEGLPGEECAWERAQPARLPEEAGRGAEDQRGHPQGPGKEARPEPRVRAGTQEPTLGWSTPHRPRFPVGATEARVTK